MITVYNLSHASLFLYFLLLTDYSPYNASLPLIDLFVFFLLFLIGLVDRSEAHTHPCWSWIKNQHIMYGHNVHALSLLTPFSPFSSPLPSSLLTPPSPPSKLSLRSQLNRCNEVTTVNRSQQHSTKVNGYDGNSKHPTSLVPFRHSSLSLLRNFSVSRSTRVNKVK